MCELALAHVAQRLVHVDERVHRSCRRRRNRRSAMGRAGRELCLAFVSSRWRPPCVHKGIKKALTTQGANLIGAHNTQAGEPRTDGCGGDRLLAARRHVPEQGLALRADRGALTPALSRSLMPAMPAHAKHSTATALLLRRCIRIPPASRGASATSRRRVRFLRVRAARVR